MSRAGSRPDWTADDPFGRRRELYRRAAPVFEKHGYRGATLKALAGACGLSIPALYRYFPSKKAFALSPLAALYPELQGPEPTISAGDPMSHLSGWIEAAVAEAPNYILAARLLREVRLSDDEERRMHAGLNEHIGLMGDLARRAAPNLSEGAARDLAAAMINIALGPALTGIQPEPDDLRRELRSLLRGYGVIVP